MSDEHSIAIVSFTDAINREMKRIRKRMQKNEKMRGMYVNIQCTGRLHTGDIKIEYSVSDSEYGGEPVKGNNLDACIAELFRRRGWQEVHAAKALAYEAIPTDDTNPVDEIPY